MKVLKLDYLFKTQIALIYVKLFCNYGDQLKNIIIIQSNIHSHKTRNNSHFSIKRFNRSKYQCHILHGGIKYLIKLHNYFTAINHLGLFVMS